jgi:hypothetical protein
VVSDGSRSRPSRRVAAVHEGASDAATVRPPFDPQEFARETERITMPPPARAPSDAPELVSGTMDVFWPVEPTSLIDLAVARDDLEWFELPPLARQLLDHVDGQNTVEVISTRSGVPIAEAMDLLDELAREGIVASR